MPTMDKAELMKKNLSYHMYKQNLEKTPKAEKDDFKKRQHRISKDCGTTAKDITYA